MLYNQYDFFIVQSKGGVMMNIIEIAHILNNMGGRLFLVGGAVRDSILGVASHDHDYLVVGIKVEEFVSSFPKAKMTGNLFPVFRLDVKGEECEFAFARKEEKVAEGHNGFVMKFDPSVTVEDDLLRRDLTMNSIAQDVLSGEFIDPFGGREDILNGVIRATSNHFIEDPLRPLRAARQAAKFGFHIESRTLELMESCAEEIPSLPAERIWGEMEKALATSRPSVFFRALKEANVLSVCFPEIFALIGQTQPEKWHPEGDAFEHSMIVLDMVAERTMSLEARFAALFHDIGKGLTPAELLPKHYGHDSAGAELLQNISKNRFPKRCLEVAILTARLHMKAVQMKQPVKIVDALSQLRRGRALTEFREVVLADSGEEIPWLADDFVNSVFESVEIPTHLKGERIREFVRLERASRVRQLLS